MNTTCRACLNYTDNGVRLLTLYKHFHYLPIMIWNCTGIKVSRYTRLYPLLLFFLLLLFVWSMFFPFSMPCHFGVCFFYSVFLCEIFEWVSERMSVWPVIALTQWYEFYVMCLQMLSIYKRLLPIDIKFSVVVCEFQY